MAAVRWFAWKWGFWIRIFGYGVYIGRDPLMFSERNGYTRVWQFMGFKMKFLHRDRL